MIWPLIIKLFEIIILIIESFAIGDRLTRFGNTTPNKLGQARSPFSLSGKRSSSSKCSRAFNTCTFVLASASPTISNTKSFDYWLRQYSIQLKSFVSIYALGAAFSAPAALKMPPPNRIQGGDCPYCPPWIRHRVSLCIEFRDSRWIYRDSRCNCHNSLTVLHCTVQFVFILPSWRTRCELISSKCYV